MPILKKIRLHQGSCRKASAWSRIMLRCIWLYPDRDWKDAVFHEDHIFPQSEFQLRLLKKRGYDDTKIQAYLSKYNILSNLQLLTASENQSKNATPFDDWIQTRDADFRNRHLIPSLDNYGFDFFEEFSSTRGNLIVKTLKKL